MTKTSPPSWRVVGQLLIARSLREMAFGTMAIVLPLYWQKAGLSLPIIGLLFTIALLGSSTLSLLLGRFADQVGRRRVLVLASALWVLTTPLLFHPSLGGLIIVALIGSLSPTGKEVGPFLAVEQAVLARVYAGQTRVRAYAWFNLVGYTSTAVGALLAGMLGWLGGTEGTMGAFHLVIVVYGGVGFAQLILYARLPAAIEVPVWEHPSHARLSSASVPPLRVRRMVYKLSGLFALDALGAGFVVQGLLVAWFHARFGLNLVQLGGIFFGTNLLSGLSSLVAVRLAQRFGLLNTMVFTHLPSNLLLILVPLMPTAALAVTLLWLRHLLSQMDVPTRQAYTMAMVHPNDRTYMAFWTNGVRHYGTAVAPLLSGSLLALPLIGLPFFIASGLKIVYDLTLYGTFRRIPLEHTDER